LLLETIVAHDVGVDEGRKTLEGFDLPLIALSLHRFDGDHAVSLGGVSSKDLTKGSLSQNAIRVEVKVIRQFDPGEEFILVDLCH
jgi:hypothetical protein